MENLFGTEMMGGEINMSIAFITMGMAVLFGVVIAATYYKTQEEENYQRSMAMTLIMLPVILSVIILFVGSNIARAFSLAGTLSIIRFRSAPGDPKDIGFIFFDIAAGLACGVGLYGYGLLFVIVLCAVIIIVQQMKLFSKKSTIKILKITITEDLNYEGAFDDILVRYTKSHSLQKIKTTELGSLFELVYNVTMPENVNEQDFLNELRCRNGNLSIILAVAPAVVK